MLRNPDFLVRGFSGSTWIGSELESYIKELWFSTESKFPVKLLTSLMSNVDLRSRAILLSRTGGRRNRDNFMLRHLNSFVFRVMVIPSF